MKPSDAELRDIIGLCSWYGAFSPAEYEAIDKIVRAELQRRQQQANVPAELSDDLLWKWFKESLKRRGLHDFDFFVLRDVAREAAVYGREQSQWVPVSERLPPPNKKVLVHYTNAAGKGRTVCGFHCGEKERDSEDYGGFEDGKFEEGGDWDWSDDGEHFYWPAGWYEEIDNWEDYSAVAICYGEPTHWMPLPEPPTC